MDDEKGLFSDEEVKEEQGNNGDDVDIYGDLGDDECRNVCKPSKPWEGLTGAGHSNEKHQENVIDDDVDIYGDLKSFEDHLAVEEACISEKIVFV